MAVWSTRRVGELCAPLVLAAERYDPRRSLPRRPGDMALGDIVSLRREPVPAGGAQHTPSMCLLADTTHVRAGILALDRPAIPKQDLGSSKRVAHVGDLLISRLRPYLRQVALVDEGLPGLDEDVMLCCSTELFVLRARVPGAGGSVAFLVPFLLSAPVQSVLAAAQEGGHHPRFDADTLLRLPVPAALLSIRDRVSQQVEDACRAYRAAEEGLARARSEVEESLSSGEVGERAHRA